MGHSGIKLGRVSDLLLTSIIFGLGSNCLTRKDHTNPELFDYFLRFATWVRIK